MNLKVSVGYFSISILLMVGCKEKISETDEISERHAKKADSTIIENKEKEVTVSAALDTLEYQNDEYFNQLGVGLVQFTNVEAKIQLYADKNMQKSIINNVLGADVMPFFYKPDYGILFFSCAEVNKDCFKIFLKNNEVAYLKKEKHMKYFSWNDFLKNEIVGLSAKDTEANLYADVVNGDQIDNSRFSSDDEIDIIDVKDNWLQINNATVKKTYWMKWSEEEKLLVDIYLLM
ncbi:hypothetical protein ABGT15_06545 [Flavobacterium enshiense]|uniref:hypothetical protein n=1 Tax=Flavobacterium enshiense TaxID=1341165 RepID=UPI00345DF401